MEGLTSSQDLVKKYSRSNKLSISTVGEAA